MSTVFLTKIMALLLSVVAFFFNTFAGFGDTLHPVTLPEEAIPVSYGSGVCEQVNIFIPENPAKSMDVLLIIHGGAWLFGDENSYNANCIEAAKQGLVAATMDYDKIQNGANAFDMVNETEDAIRAIKATLEEKGITPDKLILTGHSAGAHIALLYAYTRYETSPIPIGFVMANSAPTEFPVSKDENATDLERMGYLTISGLTGKAILNDATVEKEKELIDSISPAALVTPDVPPTVVVQGDEDEMVPFRCSVDLYNALQAAGVDSLHIVYKGAPHMLGSRFTEETAAREKAFFDYMNKYC